MKEKCGETNVWGGNTKCGEWREKRVGRGKLSKNRGKSDIESKGLARESRKGE